MCLTFICIAVRGTMKMRVWVCNSIHFVIHTMTKSSFLACAFSHSIRHKIHSFSLFYSHIWGLVAPISRPNAKTKRNRKKEAKNNAKWINGEVEKWYEFKPKNEMPRETKKESIVKCPRIQFIVTSSAETNMNMHLFSSSSSSSIRQSGSGYATQQPSTANRITYGVDVKNVYELFWFFLLLAHICCTAAVSWATRFPYNIHRIVIGIHWMVEIGLTTAWIFCFVCYNFFFRFVLFSALINSYISCRCARLFFVFHFVFGAFLFEFAILPDGYGAYWFVCPNTNHIEVKAS